MIRPNKEYFLWFSFLADEQTKYIAFIIQVIIKSFQNASKKDLFNIKMLFIISRLTQKFLSIALIVIKRVTDGYLQMHM